MKLHTGTLATGDPQEEYYLHHLVEFHQSVAVEEAPEQANGKLQQLQQKETSHCCCPQSGWR